MPSDVNTLDTERLSSYLESTVEGFHGPLTAKKFPGGQSNPTFLLKAKSGDYVLRRQPSGTLLKGAHAVDREYRVLDALRSSKVPVANVYHLCNDVDVIGSMFYVMDFVSGRVFWDPALPELPRENRTPVYLELIRVMAALHDIDVASVGLSSFGKPGNYFERQIGMWTKQYRAAETERIDAMEHLMTWLTKNLPADHGEISLIHGDYRLDNLIFHPTDTRILAVLDWELSTLGNPLADLAYFCMGLRLPSAGQVLGLASRSREQLGIPTEGDLVAHYCRLRGIDAIDNWHFYLAFSYFKLIAIVQGVLKRALDGNASNQRAVEVGRMARQFANMAVEMIEEA